MPSLSTSIHGTLAISLLGLASSCSFSLTLPGDEPTQSLWVQSIDNSNTPSRWMSDFPAEADMAVILDVQGPAIIQAGTRTLMDEQLLPENWLNLVSSSFYNTDVQDALDLENRYEDWRLVSMRVTPCGPLGIRLDQDIDDLCWPAVRLVWQPVLEDFQLLWGSYTDFYADDRAIHAIYPVHPRYADGSRGPADARDAVQGWLAQGGSPSGIPSDVLDEFRMSRDSTTLWLLDRLHDLREPSLTSGSWNALDVRPEVWSSEAIQHRFAQQLYAFLGEFAPNQDLNEMTAFSLPEGRDPAAEDIWVFLGFHGNNGQPELKNLEVIDRETGELLINIGSSQSVAMSVEDPVVEAAIEAGNDTLAESLIISNEDIDAKGTAMADPYQFLVPNTSCASCHRLNDLRFDFHSLSGFENNPITISPRVNKDVERDLNWARERGL